MRSARLEDGELRITERPDPEPGYEDAVVRITAAGVCHSDVHLLKGDWTGVPRSGPFGHEGVGVVEALGPGGELFAAVGDRVIVGLGGSGGGYWCGACEHCLGGKPRLCRQSKGILGTYSEQLKVFAKSLVVLPDSIDDHEVPLACGGLTAYGAVKKLNQFSLVPGSSVAVIGAAGGLGHYAVQIAKHWGWWSVWMWGPRGRVRPVAGNGRGSQAAEAQDVCARPGACRPPCSHPAWPASGWAGPAARRHVRAVASQ
jgi:propanol-preferring alcohol dehydrogenase